jgi:chlorite dismutase
MFKCFLVAYGRMTKTRLPDVRNIDYYCRKSLKRAEIMQDHILTIIDFKDLVEQLPGAT